jgi:hypothetical protein
VKRVKGGGERALLGAARRCVARRDGSARWALPPATWAKTASRTRRFFVARARFVQRQRRVLTAMVADRGLQARGEGAARRPAEDR